MKPKPPSNGLSARANRCLLTAGIPAEKEAVLHALKTGALYPYFRPALYGRKTHREVCRWAGLDESFVSPTIPKNTTPLAIDNGLSYRANRLLVRPPSFVPLFESTIRSNTKWLAALKHRRAKNNEMARPHTPKE